ncbi:hypothetical protein [Nannocystis bainbridge]|uniref:Uncharacterized protein n=1 Tax=Nannocystis bainbridge TaxID=2995303 RepID=A0ABT5DS57_9BACT|nr:hypothetical protein [Nannocystis bainbridge]MDC0716487.1 hypothetical protein [Nannocystis bainbridge]
MNASTEPLYVRALARPGATWVAVLLGVLLCAPSLANGLNLDDLLQAARVADGGGDPGDLFVLFGGPTPLFAGADAPWWKHEAMSLALLRPLAAVTHLVDLRLWPGQPVWMHVQSLGWYALLLVVAARVYGRLIPARWACGLATLLYAIDHSHGMVVGWLAARNGMMGATLALGCLAAYVRWREGWRPGAALAPALLLLGLLASEGAVAVCGFLAAYALCIERGPVTRRLVSLLPAAAVVVAWRVAYVAAGYGTAHSGFYFDPGDQPGFLVRSLAHGLILVWSQVFISAGEALAMAPGLFLPAALVAAVTLAGLAAWFRAELRRSAALRFWAVGTLLCALPLGSTLPTDRQLLLIGFGVFGFAAQLCAELRETGDRRAGLRWFGRGWFVLHVLLSAVMLPVRATSLAQIDGLASRAADVYLTAAPPERVVLLRAPSDLLMLYARAGRRLAGLPFPAELRYLYAGLGALTVTRVDARTLELRPDGGWLYAPLDRLFRAEADRFRVGERIESGTMSVEIVAVSPEGRPLATRMRFDRDLEDPSFAWWSWEAHGPAPFELPEVGATRTLPASRNPMLAP